jgi:putative flippase GtrA
MYGHPAWRTARVVDVALPGLRQSRWRGLVRQLVTFGAIGIASTAAYVVLYGVLRSETSAAVANACALVVTAVANTAANRRLTFGVRGGHSLLRDHLGGLIALGVALAVTTASVAVLALVAPHAGQAVELAVLIAANAAATVARFVVLRTWIRSDAGTPVTGSKPVTGLKGAVA